MGLVGEEVGAELFFAISGVLGNPTTDDGNCPWPFELPLLLLLLLLLLLREKLSFDFILLARITLEAELKMESPEAFGVVMCAPNGLASVTAAGDGAADSNGTIDRCTPDDKPFETVVLALNIIF